MKPIAIACLVMAAMFFPISTPVCLQAATLEKTTDEQDLMSRNESLQEDPVLLDKILDRIDIVATIEVEAFYEKSKPYEEESETVDEIALSTVELEIDAQLIHQFSGHLLFEYEDGKDDIKISEAMIHFQAIGVCKPDLKSSTPWFASFGKMDLPFGYYENHLISSPLTEDLGSTKTKAFLAGIFNPFATIAIGVFNPDIEESGSNTLVDYYFATGVFDFSEAALFGLDITVGASYISTIADSDELSSFIEEEFEIQTIQEDVPGFSTFLSIAWEDSIFLEVEYVATLERFKEERALKPQAWNIEFACKPFEELELAARAGGSRDSFDFLPEIVWAFGFWYEFMEDMFLGCEYLDGTFENNDELTVVTAQFIIEF